MDDQHRDVRGEQGRGQAESTAYRDAAPAALRASAQPWDTTGPIPYRVRGGDLQVVEFDMAPGDRVQCEPSAFICAAGGVHRIRLAWGRRMLDPVRRVLAGESSILQSIECRRSNGRLIVGAPHIGRVVRLSVQAAKGIVCSRGAFMAATGDIRISIVLTRRLSVGLFGGQGLIMQHIAGQGDVFVHGMGSVIDWVLDAGATIRANTHNVLAFEEQVGFGVQFMGAPWTWPFRGRGQAIFMSELTGPGRVILQSIDHAAFLRRFAIRPPLLSSRPPGAGRVDPV